MNSETGYVRVMRSHDYNQFEVCLPIPIYSKNSDPDEYLAVVDFMRKEVARLVDKAVEQFDQHKRALQVAERLSENEQTIIDAYNKTVGKDEKLLTAADKAAIALVKQRDWLESHEGKYDYEDDAPEFDDNDVEF